MFGYTEHDHKVISSQTIVRGGKDVQLDVRRPQPNDHILKLFEDPNVNPRRREQWARELEVYNGMPDYLVLMCEGNPTYLLYETGLGGGAQGSVNKEAAMALLQEDVARLVAEPDAPLKDLRWSERVQNDTGYGSNGSITMY